MMAHTHRPRIALIGAGRLATSLGAALHRANYDVVIVCSRHANTAAALAARIGAPLHTTDINTVPCDTDLCIVAISDAAVRDVCASLARQCPSALIVHTAGSMPMDTVPSARRGVFYPMQTFSKERVVAFDDIPVFVEAACAADRDILLDVARNLSKRVIELDSARRRYLHLAAVFCCNFANHCATLAARILAAQDIPFDIMLPLMDETMQKLHQLPPRDAQTGPAARGDRNVMNSQKELLLADGAADLAEIYDMLSRSIMQSRNAKSSNSQE